MKVCHPESDVRWWLAATPRDVAPYTASRIQASYQAIPAALDACPGLGGESACDIGCGSGFDTFALGLYFDRVVGIDSDPRAVAEAGRIAREAGVSNVHFECVRAERYAPAGRLEFAFCNLMSHNLPSRLALLRHIAGLLRPGGVLRYAEEAEGFPPLESHRAIRRKDAAELALRCRQVVNGFGRRKGFRFFLSSTIGPAAQACGFRVARQETPCWNGLPYLARMVGIREGGPPPAGCSDPDYVEVNGEFAEAAQFFARGIAGRWGRLSARGSQELREVATRHPNPLAPYLMYLLMADALFSAVGFRGALGERLCRWLGGEGGPRGKDSGWGELERMDWEFLALVRRRAGLDGPWDD